METNAEKKSPNDREKTTKKVENKRMAISRNISRETRLHLTELPLEIINLIIENLTPSSIVLLGLTCHLFYSLFCKQITETPLNAPIQSLPTHSKRCDTTSPKKNKLQLHHMLKNWSGLAGYKYFNTAELYRLQHPSPLAQKMNWMDEDIFSVIRAAMSVMTVAKDTARLQRKTEFGALTKRQRKIRTTMKLAGALFFKYPQTGGKKNDAWLNLSGRERFEITDAMQLWAPRVEVLKYELNLHRRLRWSQQMMTGYAEWRELVGF